MDKMMRKDADPEPLNLKSLSSTGPSTTTTIAQVLSAHLLGIRTLRALEQILQNPGCAFLRAEACACASPEHMVSASTQTPSSFLGLQGFGDFSLDGVGV